MDIGRNMNHSVSQSTVSKCIAEVSDALNEPQSLLNLPFLKSGCLSRNSSISLFCSQEIFPFLLFIFYDKTLTTFNKTGF